MPLVETYMPAPSESCSLPPPFWAFGTFPTWGREPQEPQLLPLYSMGKAGSEREKLH